MCGLGNIHLVTALLAIALSSCGAERIPAVPSEAPREWSSCSFDLLNRSEQIHFFLHAGQFRAVQLVRSELIVRESWLPVNTGGARQIKVELLGGNEGEMPFVRFSDVLGEYYLDLTSGALLIPVKAGDRCFLGEMRLLTDGESFQRYDDGTIVASVGDNRAREITGTYLAASGVHLGSIEMRVPSPEFVRFQ